MTRLSPRAALGLCCALALVACGEDGPAPVDAADTADTAEVDAPEAFTVSIEASSLGGNTPLRVVFTAAAEGAPAERLAFRWRVDGTLISEEPGFEVVFNRAGSATIELEAELLDEGGAPTGRTATDSVTITLLGCADLEFDRFTLDSPTEVAPGGSVRVRVGRLMNEGDRIERPFEVALGVSADDRWDPDEDRVLDRFEVASMPSGLSQESAYDLATRTFTVPADLAPGVYYAFLVADPGGVVNECQEVDNALAATNTLEVDPEAGQLPNLVLEDLEVAEGTLVSQGRILNYSFTLANRGEADARQFRNAFWLSADRTLDPTVDRLIAPPTDESARVQQMPAGLALGFFKSWLVPDDLPDGLWYVIGQADALSSVAETSEDDNVAVSAHPFEMRYEAPDCFDLDLAFLRVSPLTTYWGGSVQLSATVRNEGSQDVPDGVVLRAYLSLQQTLSPANAQVLGTFTLGPVPAGTERTFDILVPIGSDLPVLPHYVGAIVDPTNAWVECSESNNAALYPEPVRINALAEVDLEVSGLAFHPKVVGAGERIKVEYDLANGGTTAATTFQVGLVLSADGAVDRAGIASGADVVIDRLTVPSLAPGDARHLVRDVLVPTGLDHTVGPWVLAVMADLDGFLTSDTDLTNNLQVAVDRLTVLGAEGGCFEDEREDDDTRPAARLALPGTLEGLGSCGDPDWFMVDVPAGVSLIAEVRARPIVSVPATPSDLVVELYDPRSTLVSRQTLGPTYRAAAFGVDEPGTYAVRVAGATARDRAAYDLEVALVPPSAGTNVRPFDVVAAPSAAYAGGRLVVTWREVNLGLEPVPARAARVWLSRDRDLEPGVDVLLAEAALGPLASLQVGGGEINALLASTLAPGTWYALVEADADQDAVESDELDNLGVGGPVVLDPLKICADDAREPNDERRIATPLALASGETLTDMVVCPTLDDWYGFDLALGDSASVSIDYSHDPGKGRLVLELWAPRGQAPVLSDARNGSARVFLPSAWEAGRWYVRVANDPAQSAQAPYTYEIEAEGGRGSVGLACSAERYEPNDGPTGAPRIGCGRVEGKLCNADYDWYEIPALGGTRLSVAVAQSASQILTQLYAPGSTTPLTSVYGTGTLAYTPPDSGPLYLKVAPRSGVNTMTSFTYTLDVSGIDGAEVAVSGLASDLSTLDRGEDLGLGFAVGNQCTLPAPAFEVTAWLSLDDAVDAGDLDLWTVAEPGLAPGASLDYAPKVQVPYSTAPGVYWVIVEADSAGEIDEANEIDNSERVLVEVSEPCLDDRFEPNDRREQAEALSAGRYDDLGICAFDQDWFAVTAPAGATVTVDALFDHADGDLDLRVYDPLVSQTLPVAASTSTDDDERVLVSTPLATTLYVRVSGYGGQSAAYDLVVAID